MRNFYKYICLLCAFTLWTSCNNDEDIDENNSIFVTEKLEMNAMDKWLLNNYVYPYNIQVKYRLDDIETDTKYDLVPADVDKAIALMKIVKHVWLEAYDEVWGIQETKSYVPKLIHLIGNVAYTQSGMILGLAEGGLKVTLFRVNEINPQQIDPQQLNEFYFHTMHHEFTHILNQKKAYDMAFNKISESDYIGSSWNQVYEQEALSKGFITNYAMDRATEDFAELLSVYVTSTAEQWENKLLTAGENGSKIIKKKMDIVYNYMKQSWKLDLDTLRDVVLRRQQELKELNLSIN